MIAPHLLPALAASGIFWLAACGGLAPASRPTTESVVVGEQALIAQVAEVRATSAIPADRAIALADRYVPGWQGTPAPTAQHVALTLRDAGGSIAWGLQARPVWLVTFRGVAYAPASGPASGCACAQYAQQPTTAVALDDRDGTLVTTYGLDQ